VVKQLEDTVAIVDFRVALMWTTLSVISRLLLRLHVEQRVILEILNCINMERKEKKNTFVNLSSVK